MRKFSFNTLLIAVSVFAAGCSSTPIKPAAAGTTPMPAAAQVHVAQAPAALPVPAGPVVPAYLDPKNPISTQQSVYFDFDDFTIKSAYADLIERHGKYLASQPRVSVKIEGNADERGSAEYNLALGQKRAQAVIKALELFGVKDNQLEAISWGKERPKATGHDDAAWAQNRRADLVYPKQ